MNNTQKNRLYDTLFKYFAIACTCFGLLVLGLLLFDIIARGFNRISWEFISELPSRFPEKSGIKTALFGMVWVLVLTVLIAFPLGTGAGIYLEEYGNKNRLSKIIEINIANLAGVPSIIYGILGLEIFVRMAKLGNSILARSLTLSLLILISLLTLIFEFLLLLILIELGHLFVAAF